MALSVLKRKIELVQRRLDELQRRAAKEPAQLAKGLSRAFEQLQTALEELRAAEEELRRENEVLTAARQASEVERQRYLELFEFAPDAYLVTDPHGTIQGANRAATMLLRVGKKRLVGEPLIEFVPEEERPAFHAQLTQLQQERGIRRWDVHLKPRRGNAFPATIIVAPAKDFRGRLAGLRWSLRDITQRKQALEALQKREREFRLITDNVSALISYIGSDHRYRFVNKQYEVLFGRPRTEIVGKHVRELLGEEAYAVIRDHFETALSGQPVSYEATIPYQYGGTRWMIGTLVPDLSEQGQVRGFFHLLADITDRTQAEKALQESEERYKGLVESSPNAIFVEQDEKLVYMNPAGLRLLGYESVSELADRSLKNLFAGGGIAVEAALEMKQPTSPPFLLQGKWIQKDGRLIDVEVTIARVTCYGRPAIQGIARDVTTTNELRRKAERMERLAALGQLGTTIAHEVRNPVGSIKLNLQYLSDQRVIPEDYEPLLDDIRRGIQRIEQTVEGILGFARPGLPRLEKGNIHKVLDRTIYAVRDELQKAGITIIKQFQAVRPYAFIDTNQIIEVFVNLFLNAKEAMPTGGRLTIRTMTQGDSTVVQVEDTGEGIPPENLEKIFDPFFTTRASGTGLGLPIVARILEQHHSEISVESEVGKGTRVAIRFPRTGKGQEQV